MQRSLLILCLLFGTLSAFCKSAKGVGEGVCADSLLADSVSLLSAIDEMKVDSPSQTQQADSLGSFAFTLPSSLLSDKTSLSLASSYSFAAADSLLFPDSLSLKAQRRLRFTQRMDKVCASSLYQTAIAVVPLMAAGFVVSKQDKHYRSLRNDFMPHFKHTLDNYTQYFPAFALLGLKSFGVKSRSSWGRMLTSDAFSAAIMASVVNSLKHTRKELRPDGSNYHSFPSGHTATAFMTATMLSKEYGWRSPWISVGAYAVATGTGLMRMANNKHWLSDVMVGAGIGILSTELGYLLGDVIFKKRGLLHADSVDNGFSRRSKPSFVGLYMGFNIPLSRYSVRPGLTYRTSSGVTSGIEGAYFFNPYIGVGGRATVMDTYIIANGTEAEDATFKAYSFVGGAYGSYPITSRVSVGAKLLLGVSHYNTMHFKYATIPNRTVFMSVTGANLTFRANRRYAMRFFLDHTLLQPHSIFSKEYTHTLVAGSTFCVMW